MSRVDQVLQGGFEGILVFERPLCDILLYLLETGQNVNGGLLVSCRWGFQVCQGRLKLDGIVIIFNESSRNGGIERDAGEASICLFGRECGICKLCEQLYQEIWSRVEYALQEFTMSPHIVGWAAGELEVGVACGAGAPSINVAKRDGAWRAQVERMATTIAKAESTPRTIESSSYSASPPLRLRSRNAKLRRQHLRGNPS